LSHILFCSRRKYYYYFHTNTYVTNKCSWICVRIMKEKSLCSHPQRYLQFCPVALFCRTMHIFAINHLWNFEMLCFKNMITWNIVTITITIMNICCCLLPIYKCMDNFGTKIFECYNLIQIYGRKSYLYEYLLILLYYDYYHQHY